MTSRKKRGALGFSLMELLVSMTVLLIISSAAFTAMNGFSRTYGTSMTMADMDSGLKNAAELMTQEIGQAGIVPYSPQTLALAVVGSPTAQTVTITSTTNMYVNQMLQVDNGAAQEYVQITAIPSATTVTGKFLQNHPALAPIDPSGVFPHGILLNSTSTQLNLMGDLNGDGTLVYVVYTCTPNASGTGTLTRSISPLTASSLSTTTVLLQNLVTNPAPMLNTCFTLPPQTTSGAYNFISSVGLTLSTQSTYKDLQSGQYGTLTKSFMNISPRNILAGINMANNSLVGKLDPDPSVLP